MGNIKTIKITDLPEITHKGKWNDLFAALEPDEAAILEYPDMDAAIRASRSAAQNRKIHYRTERKDGIVVLYIWQDR